MDFFFFLKLDPLKKIYMEYLHFIENFSACGVGLIINYKDSISAADSLHFFFYFLYFFNPGANVIGSTKSCLELTN